VAGGLLIALATAGLVECAAMGIGWPLRVIGAILIGAATMALTSSIISPLQLDASEERRAAAQVLQTLAAERHISRLMSESVSAISFATDEGEVLSMLGRACATLWPDRETQLLLASSDGSTAPWAVALTAANVGHPKPMEGDGRCRALTTRHVISHDRTDRLDGCPHLRLASPGSSVCIPVLAAGVPLAAVCSIGPAGDVPSGSDIEAMQLLASVASDRLEILKPSSPSAPDEIIDPLTNLPNHLTAHREIKQLIGGLVPFSLAICDVDSLGLYNEANGAEAGDRALQLFAAALRDTLRPGDVLCRYGDDAFLALFPRCSVLNARAAMERVRESVVLDLSSAELAPFTVSVGVADSNQGTTIDELVETAGAALKVAKREGGNRVRVASFDSAD
jgi:diguanylate cyclase (GGDEF)-like protein